MTGDVARELRTLLWLQRRLIVNAIRTGHGRDLGRIASVVLLLVLSLPYVVFLGIGLAIALRTLPPAQASALVAGAFTFLMFMWIMSPMANQQLVEAPNLSRLLPHPISLRGVILGGLVTSAASFIMLATVPFLGAVVAGAGRGPGSSIQIMTAGGLLFALFVVLKSVMMDVLDLVAEDRRLRQAVIVGLGLAFMGLVLSQMGLGDFGRPEVTPFLSRLQSSPWLFWLPPGWFAGAVHAAMIGDGAGWALRCGLLAAAVAMGAGLHIRLQSRLYFGDLLRSGPVTEKSGAPMHEARHLPGLSVPDSRALRALLRKDWLNLRRSPMTSRLAFMPVMFGLMAYFGTRNLHPPAPAIGLMVGSMSAFITTAFAVNGLALLDHRGLGTLLLTPAPRRLVLLSQGLIFIGVAALMAGVTGTAASIAAGSPTALAVALLTAIIFALAFAGMGHLGSVYFPYYVDIERGRSDPSGTAFAGVLLLLVGVPLIGAPIGIALGASWILAPALLPVAAIGALVYAAAIYALLLWWAGRALAAREDRLYAEVVEGR